MADDRAIVETDREWETVPEAVLGRYSLYHEALEMANGHPFANPNYEPLFDLLSQAAAGEVMGDIQTARDLGFVYEVSDMSEHNVRFTDSGEAYAEVEGSTAVLQDCWVDVQSEINLDDGSVEREYSGVYLANVVMLFENGAWRVDALNTDTETSDGYAECKEYGEGVLDAIR